MTTTLNSESTLEDVPEGMHMLSILDRTGDTRIIWDPDNDIEVANAKRTFDDMIAKKFQAYSVNRKGEKDKKVTAFDPEAEKLILVPALVGG